MRFEEQARRLAFFLAHQQLASPSLSVAIFAQSGA